MAIHTIPRGRRSFFGKADPSAEAQRAKAEGATTPETLRQKDRDWVMNFWKVKRIPFPPKG
jgi:hypothetical protein